MFVHNESRVQTCSHKRLSSVLPARRKLMRRIVLELRDSLAQVSLFGEASGFVANHGHDSYHLSMRSIEQSDRKCNRQSSPVLMHRWNAQHVVSVARLPGRHGLSETSPMARSQTLGNNEIERVAERLSRRKSEEVLGSWIPYIDYAAGVGDHNCIADHLNQLLVVNWRFEIAGFRHVPPHFRASTGSSDLDLEPIPVEPTTFFSCSL